MGLFDSGSGSTLQDVLGQQADTLTQGINQDYAKRKRREVAMAGANGRLTSGAENYNLGDINASQATELGGVQSNLADALGGIPANDFLAQNDFNRQKQLAELIASLQKPDTLSEVFGGIGSGLNIGGKLAAFGAGK